MKTGYVIDSTIDLPEATLKKYGVRVVPLKVIWGANEYLDKQTISADEFFAGLGKPGPLPRSSAPSAGDFLNAYKEMFDKGCEQIISLHISSKLSSTLQAANIAASAAGGKVRVVDSQSISIGAGLLLLEAIKLAEGGGTAKEVEEVLSQKNGGPDIYFVVDDLNYLFKGGRIGRAKKILGTMLDIKPLLFVKNGEVAVKDKIIGKKNVLKRIEKIFQDWKQGKRKISRIAVIYSNSKEKIRPILALSKKYFPEIEPIITQASPVVGCHVGPGLMAVSAY